MDVDPEIMHAAALGLVLQNMRAELSDDAIRRVIAWGLERWGVYAPVVEIRPIPRPSKPAMPVAPGETKPATAPPIKQTPCPMCSFRAMNPKGLTLHMYRKHGTTPKEYARTQALDT